MKKSLEDNIEITKDNLKKALAEGKLNFIFKNYNKIKGLGDKLKNDFLLVEGRMKFLENFYFKGLLSQDEYIVAMNKVSCEVLILINAIETPESSPFHYSELLIDAIDLGMSIALLKFQYQLAIEPNGEQLNIWFNTLIYKAGFSGFFKTKKIKYLFARLRITYSEQDLELFDSIYDQIDSILIKRCLATGQLVGEKIIEISTESTEEMTQNESEIDKKVHLVLASYDMDEIYLQHYSSSKLHSFISRLKQAIREKYKHEPEESQSYSVGLSVYKIFQLGQDIQALNISLLLQIIEDIPSINDFISGYSLDTYSLKKKIEQLGLEYHSDSITSSIELIDHYNSQLESPLLSSFFNLGIAEQRCFMSIQLAMRTSFQGSEVINECLKSLYVDMVKLGDAFIELGLEDFFIKEFPKIMIENGEIALEGKIGVFVVKLNNLIINYFERI